MALEKINQNEFSESSEKAESRWYTDLKKILVDLKRINLGAFYKKKENALKKKFEEEDRKANLPEKKEEIEELTQVNKLLRNLRRELIETEKDEELKNLHLWMINTAISQVEYLIAIRDFDEERYKRYANFSFRTPKDPDYAEKYEKLQKEVEMEAEGEEKPDSVWYWKIKDIIAELEQKDFRKLPKKREEELRKKFYETGEIPDLTSKDMETEDLEEIESSLRAVRKELMENEKRPEIRLPYLWRINTSIARIGFLKASVEGDMRNFKRYVEFIYGKPDKETFNYTLSTLQNEITEAIQKGNEELKQAAEKLKAAIPEAEEKPKKITHPTKEEFQKIKEVVTKEFGDILENIDETREYNAEEIKELFKKALSIIGNENWRIKLDEKRKFISINSTLRKIEIPSKKTEKGKKVKKLIAHEIFGHALRTEKGNKGKLKLLKQMDRYIVGEESLTVLKTQSLDKDLKSFGDHPNHLAIGLVYGLDGKKRNFKEIYEILLRYYRFEYLRAGEDPEKAKDTAWDRCLRYFKGTDGKEGVCYTKDIIYREGNAKLWTLLKKHPELLQLTSLGKWDINNPTHWWTLLANGIIKPEDIKYLEEIEAIAFDELKPGFKKELLEKYRAEILERVNKTI